MSEKNKNTSEDRNKMRDDKEVMIRKVISQLEGPIINPGLYIEKIKRQYEAKGDKECH